MEPDSERATFPPSLPVFDEEPRIFDTNMMDTMQHNGLEFTSLQDLDSPRSNFFWDHPTGSSPAASKSSVNQAMKHSLTGPLFSQSPESSSASDFSNNQHKRHHSSDSSRSGALAPEGDIQMANAGILIGTDPENQSSDESSPVTDVDLSNRAMECHFDFDSAASSPTHFSDTKLAFKFSSSSIKPIKMPYRCSSVAGFAHGFGHQERVSTSPSETSPLSSMLKSQRSGQPVASPTPAPPVECSRKYINTAMLSEHLLTPRWSYEGTDQASNNFSPTQPTLFQHSAVAMPFASPLPLPGPAYPPALHVHPLPPKSRVETQIPVKLTLHPVPPGISTLHLQAHTISKSKLVAKPSPEKSPDMLELHVMLVCTSAMQDPTNRGRAFARAALSPPGKGDARRSSSSGATASRHDEDKPVNGGPVHICKGCIERERKRAARKKTKNVEEEQLWQKDEAKRIIVFNTQEVKEWQEPSLPRSGASTQNPGIHGPSPSFPKNAVQVDIPMRIACYCRHQEEKLGFQVIFTIRDYQDNMIAQTMSNSIVITDDHKTHVLPGVQPSHSPLFPENSQAHGESVFSQAPTSSRGPASFRHAYSTTDLQGMQQQLNSQPRSHLTMPLNRSETTSATLIPKNLSRQASPSAPSGQQHKRRKASASGRIRNELTMTKIETPGDSNIIDPGVSSAGQSIAQGSNGLPTFIPNIAAPSNGLPMPPMPLQFNTNSPTSNTTDSTFFSSAQRSQSMENLQGFPRMFSSPSSVRPSRVPSPTSGHQGNALAQSHAQMLTNSLHSVHGAINTLRPPVIHKLTPGEGSKSGGIEVTCLGSGFCQGLEVMFGDAQATTTTYWGESALVCLVPPALQAGVVPVTFKHNYEHNIPSPQTKQAFFKYNDDDEQELMKHALALINRKWNGHASDGSDSARNIINLFGNASSISSSNQSTNQNPQTPCSYATLRGVAELEGALLNCLNTVDLDDSPYQASFNTKGINGQSMLHLSASMGYYRLAAGLLARGANPDLRDNNGMTPMHMASLRNHVQIIRKLRSAGSDPTLRSLNGYTAADMATSQQARDASTAFDCHSRSRSAGATPVSQLSRPSSVMSNKPLRGVQSPVTTAGVSYRKDGGSSGDRLIGNYRRQPATPAQMWGPSRRNSLHAEQQNPNELSRNDLVPNASLFVVNPAMSAWRDQLSAQIQQLQQSVHRTLPTLQIPALPPIPNLPDYQAYPVVRRISSLVPQRNSRSSTVQNHNGLTKEADYCWWELLTGAVSSPPAYDEIYPENKKPDRKASTLRAAEDLIMDRKCEGNFDHAKESSVIETVKLGSGALTKGQLEQLRSSHAIKVRKLKKDRTLLFIWIPLLTLLLLAMLRDWMPLVSSGARAAFRYASNISRSM